VRVRFIATSATSRVGAVGWVLSLAFHAAVVVAYNVSANAAERAGPIEEPLPQALTFLVPPSASPDQPVSSLGYQEPGGAQGDPAGEAAAERERLDALARQRGRADSIAAAEAAAEAARLAAAAEAASAAASIPADVFMEIEVDSAAERHPDSAAPAYPPDMMLLGIEGYVAVRFVVDTTGMIDLSSVRIIEESRPEFAQAVREALPRMRFRPARRGAVPVRQLAEQLFRFQIKTATPPPATPATPPVKPPSRLPVRRPAEATAQPVGAVSASRASVA